MWPHHGRYRLDRRRLAGPIAASTFRLASIGIGGWVCVHLLALQPSAMFLVVAFSMALYALTLSVAIRFAGWGR